jgi:hypothetical protein
VANRVQNKIRFKIFYRWFDGYFTSLETSYYNYTRGLKKKVIRSLLFEQRKSRLKIGKALVRLSQNTMYKVWLALLRHLN